MRHLFLAALFTLALAAAGCSESKPDCKGSATVCGDSCVQLATDNANCGSCGNACAAGKVCSAGACTCPTARPDACGTGATAFCTDLDLDPQNCGTCGTACAAGKLCSGGACVQNCAAAQAACPSANPTYCADTTRDANNCGSCGTSCPLGQQCASSACSCPTARPNACGSGTSAFCTDFQTDPENCGSCGTACAGGEVCSGGSCVQTCSATQATACPTVNPTYCANTQVDANNCGSCGNACAAGQACVTGTCSCPTTTPDACTTGGGAHFCTNLDLDPLNCGTCGVACGSGTACSNGTCVTSCPPGEYACDGKCIDPLSDPNYCGAASDCSGRTVCGTDQACLAGRCRALWPPCSWTELAFHDLATAPQGSITRNSPLGSQGPASVGGRTAWLQTADWNEFYIPMTLGADDDVFAVQAEGYLPTDAVRAHDAVLSAFTGYPNVQGVWAAARQGGPGGTGSIRVGGVVGGSVVTGQEIAFAQTTNVWTTVRLEGRRSSKTFVAIQDGIATPPWSSNVDLPGTYFNVGSGKVVAGYPTNIAWSNFRVFKGTDGCFAPLPRSCSEVMASNPGATSGRYTIDPDGPGAVAPYGVYCDMTTAGGGWTLVLAYDHPAGGTAPVQPGVVPVDPAHGYSHLSSAQLAALPFTSMRFYCQTTLHSRKIDAIFGSAGAVAFIKGLGANAVGYWTTFTPLADHTANLPAATADADMSIPLDNRIAFEPFHKAFAYHWNIGATPSYQRFECDDWADGPANATLHQVWVR